MLLLSIGSFVFYVQSYLETDYKQWFYRALSSFTMLCLGLTWQGVGLFVSIVITVELVRVMVEESYDGRATGLLALWILPIIVGLLLLKFEVYSHLSQPYVFMVVLYPVSVLFIALILLVVQRISSLKKFLSISQRVPLGFSMSFLLTIVGFPLMSDRIFNALIPSLINPFGKDPVLQMIGELQKLGALGWAFWSVEY